MLNETICTGLLGTCSQVPTELITKKLKIDLEKLLDRFVKRL